MTIKAKKRLRIGIDNWIKSFDQTSKYRISHLRKRIKLNSELDKLTTNQLIALTHLMAAAYSNGYHDSKTFHSRLPKNKGELK